jgi:hypothetical protein
MKKIGLSLLLLTIAGNLLFTTSCVKKQEKKIKNLEDNIALLQTENTPVRFKIIEKTEDSLSLIVKFYNADKKEINHFKKILNGQELSFDFFVVPVKDKYVAFPAKIFTDRVAADDGIVLYNFYDQEGYPAIFYHKNINENLYRGLKDVYQNIKKGQLDSVADHFGNMVHDIKKFNSFLPGNVYSIVVHTKGGIEIIEE